jgi:HEAT repeat protein
VTKRRALWLLFGLLVLVALAVLIPGSPAYAPRLFARYAHFHDGHSLGYWTDALDSTDTRTRLQAIFALGAMGPGAGEAVPQLSAVLLDDPDGDCRSAAALALSKMVPASRTAVPALARALEDAEPLVRMNAATALFGLRAEARPAVPALMKAVKDEANRQEVRPFPVTIQETAALALGRASAGSDEAVPTLVEALEAAETEGMRRSAARALGEVGLPARPAVSRLRELLNDRDGSVREAAAEALRKIEGEAPAG